MLVSLLFLSEFPYGMGGLMYLLYSMGFLLPWIVPVAVLALVNWQRSRQLASPTEACGATPAPPIVVLVVLTWIFVSLLSFSEPGGDFPTWVLWWIFTIGLGLSWLGLLVPAAYKAFRARSLARLPSAAAYLLILPLAAIVLFVLVSHHTPLKARFQLSEPALSDLVRKYQSANTKELFGGAGESHWIGLYSVRTVYRRDGCVMVQTTTDMDFEAGLAFCTGSRPEGPNLDMDHIDGLWWRYARHQL